ncbi:ABC-2 transporter permease [[Clostridium] scindens]|nr:ABC-2 transporter permease [[Clostridium] scindens]NSJ03396.1 ABC-2 transporter permease [[Clostridium] scindens]
MAAAVSGRVAFAVAVLAVLLFYFEILAQYVLLGMSQEIFHTFYRIPLLEEAGRLLVPARLADTLAGTFLYEKREVLEYFPNGGQICAALAWILLLGVAILLVLGRRKTEMTGRGFASRLAERVTEFLLSVLAGLCACTLILKIFHIMGEGGLKGVLCLTLAGVVGTLAVHLLVEGLVRVPLRKIARRKGQLAAECIAVCVAALAFLEGRDSFDGFYPRPDQIKGLSIFMNGVDIDQAQYEEIEAGRDHYLIDSRLAQYSLHENGMEEGLAWLRTVCRQGKGSGRVTTATVCYEMKSGAMKYRAYPVDEESLDAFAGVYECGEYKEKAYPLTEIKEADQERLVWSDGVLEQTLRLTAQEKKDFLAAYKADVDSLKLAELKESLPVGYIELESEVSAKDMRAAIYPFFGRTCNFLKEHGADVGKQIKDYKIVGLKVKNMPSGTGNTGVRFYQEEEDLEAWRGKLVPEDLAIQPILHPVDGRTYAEAEIKDEDTSSVTITQCYGKAK